MVQTPRLLKGRRDSAGGVALHRRRAAGPGLDVVGVWLVDKPMDKIGRGWGGKVTAPAGLPSTDAEPLRTPGTLYHAQRPPAVSHHGQCEVNAPSSQWVKCETGVYHQHGQKCRSATGDIPPGRAMTGW